MAHLTRYEGARFADLYPPGHFYSPLPSTETIDEHADRIFATNPSGEIPGVDLRPQAQLDLIMALAEYYDDMPWDASPRSGLRYNFGNGWYDYSDAICLYGMMRHLRPKRIIEVGSGYSSALMLDTADMFLEHGTEFTFVEPFPDRLRDLLSAGDEPRVEVLECALQDVDTAVFAELTAGDILLVDSTHVTKVDSDVNHLFFRILPTLAPDVYVHVHDIFAAFEYPREWFEEGRAWNEQYLLRAFLQYNSEFEVVLFNNYLVEHHRNQVLEAMPLMKNDLGGSIWLRRR